MTKVFGIGSATLKRLVRRKRENGTLEPEPPPRGFTPRISGARLRSLRLLLERHPDATPQELADMLNQRIGSKVSRSAAVRALKRPGITRKKDHQCVGEFAPHVVGWTPAFKEVAAGIPLENLVFTDEAGATISMTRTYPCSPRGQRERWLGCAICIPLFS